MADGTIRITPEELREGADTIDSKMNDMIQSVGEIKQTLDRIREGWEGLAQDAFFDTFEGELFPILNDKVPEVVQGIQTQLKVAADAMEEADQQVAGAMGGGN